MTAVSPTFRHVWRSGQHTGSYAPVQMLEIRLGRFYRGYGPQWNYPEPGRRKPYAIIPHSPSHNGKYPWQATWTPFTGSQGEWTQVPGLAEVTLDKGFDKKGITGATITLENVGLNQKTGKFGAIYHMIDRGYLAPWRGYHAPGRPKPSAAKNEWFQMLVRNAQVRIWQGYGSSLMVPTFTGLIDAVDATSAPDELTVSARDFGRTLADQRVFGWVKDPAIKDPIVFADRIETEQARAAGQPVGAEWILVDDASDVVRLVLQWAGFKHFHVEKTGVRLTGTTTFNRSNYLMDIIDKMSEATSFQFFMGDPDPNDPESIGVPVYRYPRALVSLDDTVLVRDSDLLTGIKVSQTDDPLAYIIRVRGQIVSGSGKSLTLADGTQLVAPGAGITLGGDATLRPMFTYRPPWTKANRMSGVLKHVTHTDDMLQTVDDCRIACFLIAAQEALQSATAIAEVPGNPEIELDGHVSLMDTGTGLATRLYTTNVQSTFVSRLDQDWKWSMSFGGSLLDTPDLVDIRKEMKADNIKNDPSVRVPALRG